MFFENTAAMEAGITSIKPIKIFVVGTRGIPDIPGGVEKHCQELYPRIVDLDYDVIVCTRAPYVKQRKSHFKGVSLEHVFTPRIKSLEAIVHTLTCLILALRFRPDVVHIHTIGPSLLVPLARLMGFKVVMTHHGPDYNRQKWGRLAKWMLKTGEYLGGQFAHEVIVISLVIEKIVTKRCGRSSNLVHNGVPVPVKSIGTEYLDRIKVVPGRYILAVARLVPEKGLHDLINAFSTVRDEIKLVIAGDADHETGYSLRIKTMVQKDNQAVMTGYITGEYLKQVFSHAALFVLPSYHEGLPIALLEAMSYGVPPLVSDIPANLEVGLNKKHYFPCGDVEVLRTKIADFLERPVCETEKRALQKIVVDKYNWDNIARQTIDVYRRALRGR